MQSPAKADEDVPVLIVGGGGAGLTASMLLARLGVRHLLVSARPQTSDLPKAHVLNQRAMEVLEDAGVAAEIERRSTPAAAAWQRPRTTRASPARTRTTAGAWRAWSAGEAGTADENWRAASPWRQLNLPQIRLEPLLKHRAEELSPGAIRFGHELTGLDQDSDGVRATIRDTASGRELRRGQPVPGRGGRRRGPWPGLIGVTYEGLGVVTQTATLHVTADLSAVGAGPGRADPVDLLAAGRTLVGAGPDGARAAGARARRNG